MHKGRARIYEIPLHTAEARTLTGGNPTVIVYPNRTIYGHPYSWQIRTRDDAAKTLQLARRLDYKITRRYLTHG